MCPNMIPQGYQLNRSSPFFGLENQATHLPNEVNSYLLNIKKLTSRSSTTVWTNEILNVLRPFELDALIDYDLPRPRETDQKFARWRFWTPVVARWLLDQVEEPIQQQVQSHTTHLTFADEVFRTIRTVNLGHHRLFIEREREKWQNLSRDNFDTATDFIMAYQNQFNRLKIEGEEDPCGMALCRLLNELEGEFLRASFIRSEVNGMGREVDYRMFNYYCRLLISETREFRDTDAGGGLDTGRGHGRGRGRGRGTGGGGSGDGGRGSDSGSLGGDVSYRNWRRGDVRQPR
ncbi:unnamed protein product [Penicillium olsonii]|nr:unnamed protein product [Penicillium olsonii]